MYIKIVQIVEHVLVNTSVQNATSLMTMYQRTNFTVMDVAYVELVVQRTSITVGNADVAIPIS